MAKKEAAQSAVQQWLGDRTRERQVGTFLDTIPSAPSRMSEKTSDKKPTKRIFCNRCKRETNHILQCEHRNDVDFDGGGEQIVFNLEEIYRLWICAGCEVGTLETELTDWFIAEKTGEPESFLTYSPKRTSKNVRSKYFRKLPEKLRTIYQESVNAYNGKLHLLCAAGLRSLMEGICADQGITRGKLHQKINALKKVLPDNIVDNLHSFRFMGNEAVHDLTLPGQDDLRLAIEISEDLLNYLYELDYKARRLTLARQERKEKAAKKAKTLNKDQ